MNSQIEFGRRVLDLVEAHRDSLERPEMHHQGDRSRMSPGLERIGPQASLKPRDQDHKDGNWPRRLTSASR